MEYGTGDINFPVGQNATNIPVVIMQNGTIIRRVLTDQNGNFNFTNIPIMNYSLVVDYPGKSMVAHSIRLNSSDITVDNQNFTLQKTTVEFNGSNTSIEETKDKKLEIYPNPCSHTINLKNAIHLNHYTIIDYTGKTRIEGSDEILNSIDVSDLESGLYFLLLEGEGNREVIRLTKE